VVQAYAGLNHGATRAAGCDQKGHTDNDVVHTDEWPALDG
jgi:hypothetical protein